MLHLIINGVADASEGLLRIDLHRLLLGLFDQFLIEILHRNELLFLGFLLSISLDLILLIDFGLDQIHELLVSQPVFVVFIDSLLEDILQSRLDVREL